MITEQPFPCCDSMRQQLKNDCPQHPGYCPDWVISEDSGEHFPQTKGTLLLIAPNAAYSFDFCPWCGRELPEERKRH